MCDVEGKAVEAAITRRKLLGGAGVLGAAEILGISATPPAVAAERPASPDRQARDFRTRLVLLGTSGGPPWWPGTTRVGNSSAIVVDGGVYIVDFGHGSGKRVKEAELVPEELRTPGGLWGLERLRGMFITHLHSDHVMDYFSYFLTGWVNGLRMRPASEAVQVFGPGRRVDENGTVVMEPIFTLPGEPPPDIPVVNPENPVPGTVDMTDYLVQAYALDLNDRLRDNRIIDPRTQFEVHDIEIPRGIGYHPNDNPTPAGMAPIPVYEDDVVRVTATLVQHFPIVPAFALRFDTDDGSIVISGDTGPTQNVVNLARGADILVHEVIDPAWVDVLFPPPRTLPEDALRNHLLTAHTLPEDVGRIAEDAGVGTLVLSHLVPANAPRRQWLAARRHFSGRLVVGDDLMQVGVGSRRARR